MIKDFVRDGKAFFVCTECGAETPILKYVVIYYQPGIPEWGIDYEGTKAQIEAFILKHSLCRNPVSQADFNNQLT